MTNGYEKIKSLRPAGCIRAHHPHRRRLHHAGWVLIDEGYGDRYNLCQGNYFPQPIMDDRGIYRYKLVDGKPVERTQEEMDADYVPPEVKPTDAERISQLESEKKLLTAQVQALSDRNDFMEDCIAEMATIVYA